MKRTIIIIPARWGSTRLPAKPLVDILGKPMIQWVYDECKKSVADEVYVATDDERIHRKVIAFGGKSIMTSDCKTGTDRIIEAAKDLTYDILVNIQGDEPGLTFRDINSLIHLANKNPNSVSTLSALLGHDDLKNRNVVKLVKSGKKIVMFTRSSSYLYSPDVEKHIGAYAFPKDVIKQISKLRTQTENEIAESLEQLRWADSGISFVCNTILHAAKGVDTPEDVIMIESYLKQSRKISI
jgi:3-deoxy-D-manno-octulosonate cytidylyltransferase